MSYEGPTKSLVDDLASLFGLREVRWRPEGNDEQVSEFRITETMTQAEMG
jgi:hypothetical protein